MGLRRMLTSGRRVPSLDRRLKRDLSERYSEEFEELERTWSIDLSAWRDGAAIAGASLPEGPENRRSA
jgi:hypothetical protein